MKVLHDGKSFALTDGKEQKVFAVDEIFDSRDPMVTQTLIFKHLGKDLVLQALKGYNVTIFAYGHTGSGKTYTMIGENLSAKSARSSCCDGSGLLPRFIGEVFEAHGQDMQPEGLPQPDIHYSCEYYEVYNEQIRDLLAPEESKRERKVRVHPKHGVVIEGLCTSVVTSPLEALNLVNFGNHMRAVASTTMNDRSSRSHAIFTFRYDQVIEDGRGKGADGPRTGSTLTFIDLAGREDQAASMNREMQFREMCYINTSLFYLGHLINKLSDPKALKTKSLADFRNTKLTLIMSTALGGNSHTALVATLAPAMSYYADNISTMNFAKTVKKIANCPLVNKKSGDPVKELEAEMSRLRAELAGAKTGNYDTEQELAASQLLVEKYKQNYETALSESRQNSKMRTRMSNTLGFQELSGARGDPVNIAPFLTKLSDDACMQGCCNYYMTPVPMLIGGDQHTCAILVKGIGIQKRMCAVTYEPLAGVVAVSLVSNSLPSSSGDGDEDGTSSYASDEDSAVWPRVLVNGRPLTPERKRVTLEHGDCIFLGYSHAFRLVVPPPNWRSLAENVTDLARMTVDSLDVVTAASDIIDDYGGQFQELRPYLGQLSVRVKPTFVDDLLKSLRAVCPLVDEANLITQHVLGRSRLRFQLQVLTDLFHFEEGGLPELVICVREETPTLQVHDGTASVPVPGAAAALPRGSAFLLVPQARQSLTSAMSLQFGQALLYVWTLEKFLQRLDEMRDIYQDGTEAHDGFTSVQKMLQAKQYLNPWREMAFADIKRQWERSEVLLPEHPRAADPGMLQERVPSPSDKELDLQPVKMAHFKDMEKRVVEPDSLAGGSMSVDSSLDSTASAAAQHSASVRSLTAKPHSSRSGPNVSPAFPAPPPACPQAAPPSFRQPLGARPASAALAPPLVSVPVVFTRGMGRDEELDAMRNELLAARNALQRMEHFFRTRVPVLQAKPGARP